VLIDLGHRLVEEAGALAALRLVDVQPAIAWLFTDIVRPDTNGRKLAEEALRRRPDLRVLCTNSYTRDAAGHDGVANACAELIAKPFIVDQLAVRLRAILDVARQCVIFVTRSSLKSVSGLVAGNLPFLAGVCVSTGASRPAPRPMKRRKVT
jgi:CheY-like chemotaxis protein